MTDQPELDEFRRKWQDEVRQRQEAAVIAESKKQAGNHHAESSVAAQRIEKLSPSPEDDNDGDDDIPNFDKQEERKVVVTKHDSHIPSDQEVFINKDLTTNQKEALEAFEKAAEREHVGKLADAIKYYRRAYRKDGQVDKLYREKYFSKNKPILHKHHVEEDKAEHELVEQLKETKLSDDEVTEQGPIMHLPTELVVELLRVLALRDLSGFTRATYTCRKFAYLGYSSPGIWKSLCLKEYSSQHYTEQAIEDLGGIRDDIVIGETLWDSQWKKMYCERPRVWLNGVYISTCNYVRPGVAESWNAPVHMVTYYRYLRFFEDGTCVNLLTTQEPSDVVPVFNSRFLGHHASGEDAPVYTKEDGTVLTRPKNITHGSWAIQSGSGRLFIETEGSVHHHTFYMQLDIKSSGKNKHNKLKWVKFWNRNKLTQNEGEFTLKHDKAYYFVRTRNR